MRVKVRGLVLKTNHSQMSKSKKSVKRPAPLPSDAQIVELYWNSKRYKERFKRDHYGLPIRFAMNAEDKEDRYLNRSRTFIKENYGKIRRLPIRPGQDINKSISRSALACNLAELSFEKANPALEAAGLYVDKIGILQFKILLNDKTKELRDVTYDQPTLNAYMTNKNKLLYFSIWYAPQAHIIGGIMIKNDLDELYVFVFGSYTENVWKIRNVQQGLVRILDKQPLRRYYVITFPEVLGQKYKIQHLDPTFVSEGECQEFSILIPILMARALKAEFEATYGTPRVKPQTLIQTITNSVKTVYDRYNLISLEDYNQTRRDVGLLGGGNKMQHDRALTRRFCPSLSPIRKRQAPRSKARSR